MEALRQRTATLLDAAYDAGVRHVDAARSYGRAEEFLAHWLRMRPEADDVVVSSKWGYRYVGDWSWDATTHEVKDHSLEAFTTQLGETRALLGDRLAIHQLHSLTPDSPALSDRELHAALSDLAASGVCVGFTTSGPDQGDVVRRALEIEIDGAPVFSLVQSTWNLLEPSVGPALAEAHGAGLEVVVKEAVANGRLTDGPGSPPGAARLAHRIGVPLDRLALAAALAQPWASRVLSGAVTVDQLASNLAAARVDLPEAVLDELATVAEDPPAYWRARSARAWT